MEAQEPSQMWWMCPICGAFHFGGPPHGADEPCPQKVKVDEAYIDMLTAQKESFLGQGLVVGDMGETIKELFNRE